MPATSLKVTRCSPLSTRRARERAKLPRPPSAPPELARRAIHTNSATIRMTGPKPSSSCRTMLRPLSIGRASIVTSLSISSFSSEALSANCGISVSNCLAGSESAFG
jgi:hypothetical protein